ncbi:hypothetical protein E1B28_002105 [Marasmius oreades]|uniref:Uncharacterized protein n=1 Tax=Marasmius oreades TaxID=181124 RepID=A0A9P7UMS1_9AGAR|nr:uncharacterized protein E1B28_002105 [Marasmius oreades]KAG7086146.1 hypothetical protein E1B28_002105 [Marasmius oreades]
MASSDDDLKNSLEPYMTMAQVLVLPISTVSVLYFIYVVFGLSIHVLYFHHNGSTSKLYLGCTIALFLLATIYIAMNTWGNFLEAVVLFSAASSKDYTPLVMYLEGDVQKGVWSTTTSVISNLMNSIADLMLIHRCYIIWNSKKLVLYPLALIAFILNGIDLGCIIAISFGLSNLSKESNSILIIKALSLDSTGVAISIVAFQIILAFITGGRIWWISYEARKMMGKSTHTKYKTMVIIIIESGFLYASTMLAVAVVNLSADNSVYGILPFDPFSLSTLISGLAPTLIIVRVAYGKSINSVQQVLSTMNFADGQESQQQDTSATKHVGIGLKMETQSNSIIGKNLSHGADRSLRVKETFEV